jgi:glycosyltransferase involved in cell wall biosynthesis
MKLLFVVNTFEYFVSHRLDLARAAQKRGWDVHIACPPSVRGISLDGEHIIHHPLSLDRKGLNPRREIGALLKIKEIYEKVCPDLVHLIGPKAVMYGGFLAWYKRLPAAVFLIPGMGYVYTIEGIKGRVIRVLNRLGYRVGLSHRNKRVIFQNPDDLDLFISDGLCSKSEAKLILGSGVDPDLWRAGPEPGGVPVVVFASRLLKEKGVELFVDAARLLLNEGVKARFALVGQTDPAHPSSVSAAQLERWRGEGVEYWGFKDDMPRIFQSCHIFCLPTYRREGIPKVLIEAASCGLPIVTTDMPGCREVVRDGLTGFLIPPKDVGALKSALHRLIGDSVLRLRLGQEARRRVESLFSLERVIEQTLDVYDQVRPWKGQETSSAVR